MIRLLACVALLAWPCIAQPRIITTTPDLMDIAVRIGGDSVRVDSLTAGHEDLHLVRIRPSLLVKLRRADGFIQMGLDAEHAWVPDLMRKSRNSKIRPGAPGFCDASMGIRPMQVLASTSRAQGPDVHPRGNPHYNLDPTSMRIAARNVCACLCKMIPRKAPAFRKRLDAWEKQLDTRLEKWKSSLAEYRGAGFIESHSAWCYFARTFDLRIVERLEPKPGLAPTPRHLAKVMKVGAREHVGLIVGRPQFADVAKRVATRIGATAATLPISSMKSGKLKGWFTFMDHVVATFARTLTKSKSDAAKAKKTAKTPVGG